MFIAQWVYPESDVVPIENFTWVSKSRSSRPPIMDATGSIVMTKTPNIHTRLNNRTFGDFLLLREEIDDKEIGPYVYDAIRSTALNNRVFRETIEQGATELPIRRNDILKHALRVAGAAPLENPDDRYCAAASLVLVAADEGPVRQEDAVETVSAVISLDAASLHGTIEDVDNAVPQPIRSRLASRATLWR